MWMPTATMNSPAEFDGHEFDGRWELIHWRDALATGNDGIDDEHRKLLSLFNEFAIAVNATRTDDQIRSALDELLDYTKQHFSYEERLMRESLYPDFSRHKIMHINFSRKFENVSNQLRVNSDMCAFLLSFLAKWFGCHIQDADRKLGHYLERHNCTSRTLPPSLVCDRIGADAGSWLTPPHSPLLPLTPPYSPLGRHPDRRS
ncbi:MAG: bacteriohemerythrin [Rhodospirillaceae bacterium]